jgi:rSAM/selenodomain-associated transferase 1
VNTIADLGRGASPVSLGGLCIFARAPELGRVKSRLAASVGDAAALAAHGRLVEDTLARLAHVPGITARLCIAGDVNHGQVQAWSRAWQIGVAAQCSGDLGQRMDHALRQTLATCDRALLVGTDCPGVDAAYVTAAAQALVSTDLVLGPAADGGYGLIGLRSPQLPLFRDMPWGTDLVAQLTLERAAFLGLTVTVLQTIWDVDTEADWQRFLQLRGAAPL